MAHEQEVKMLVDSVWERILNENHRSFDFASNESDDKFSEQPEASKFWTTLTLFISSTFRDMGPDREYIVKKVLPALSDWAEKRGIRIVECDLRWGVPKHSTSVDTIETCLGELEIIKANSKGQPLFLCLLSERYGWIPQLTDIPQEMAERYKWIDSLSITHMEIMQGAIRCKNRNALFCFRSPDFVSTLSENQLDLFVEHSPLEKTHIDRLKNNIVKFLPEPKDQVYMYEAVPKESTSESTGVDFEFNPDFGDKILSFFKDAIERLYPGRSDQFKTPNPVEQDNFHQWSYFERRCVATFGFNEWSRELATLLQGKVKGESVNVKSFDITSPLWDSIPDDNFASCNEEHVKIWPCALDANSGWTSKPVCLVSEPGHGKTSILSCIAKDLLSSGQQVFFHYCGVTVSPGSLYYREFIKRLIHFLLTILEIPKTVEEVTNAESLYQTEALYDLLCKLQACPDKRVFILVDAAQHMNEVSSGSGIHWHEFLPIRFPENCAVFFTATTEKNHWIHKYFTYADATIFKMPDVPLDLRTAIVTKYFEAYNKRLDKEQLSKLVNKEAANLPLWLKLACEELRVFGNFREVTSKIENLEQNLEGLLVQILGRIADETLDLPIGRFLSYLAVSPEPLPDSELPKMLGSPEKGEELKPFELAKLKLILKPFISIIGSDRTIVMPFHSSLTNAASRICKLAGSKVSETKRNLAMYMIKYGTENNKIQWGNSLMNLLWESDCREELLAFVRKQRAFISGAPFMLQRFRCPNVVFSNAPSKMMRVPFNSCFQCSMKHDFELNARVLEQCWVCKIRLFHSFQPRQAVACASHPQYPPGGTGQYTCRICGMFKGQNYNQWTPIQLCEQCFRQDRCAHVAVDQSWWRYRSMIDPEND